MNKINAKNAQNIAKNAKINNNVFQCHKDTIK